MRVWFIKMSITLQQNRPTYQTGENHFNSLTYRQQLEFLRAVSQRAAVLQNQSAETKGCRNQHCYYDGKLCGDFCASLSKKGKKYVDTLRAILVGVKK